MMGPAIKQTLRTLNYLRPYSHLAVVVVLLIIAAGLADLLAPWPLKVLVDNVLGDQPLPPALSSFFDLSQGRTALLWGAVIAGLVVVLIHNLLTVLNN